MDDNKIVRQRITIAVIGFVILFGIISVIALINSRDKAVPVTVSSLPEASKTPVNKSGVYGAERLNTTLLSSLQVIMITQQLENFIATYQTEALTSVTIEKDSVSTSSNNADKSNEIRFIVSTNNGTRYQVSGKYLYVSDMHVSIAPAVGGAAVYVQVDDEHFDE